MFVRPQEASRHSLPGGFAFDPDWNWIQAIHFGDETTKRADEDRRKLVVAKELGFDTVDKLNDAKWFAGLNPEVRKRVKIEFEDKCRIELPDHQSKNPERRAAQVGADAASSPERSTEKRLRSVSLDREAVKKEADPYLRQQYTNSEGKMICQVCKTVLPFKYPDGSYYVEITEFLPELKRRHHQNYLALCPNHSAMFRHANGSRDLLKELFLEILGNNLEVILAEDETTIYFTQTHLSDLRVVINADQETKTGPEEDRPLEKTLMGKEGDIEVNVIQDSQIKGIVTFCGKNIPESLKFCRQIKYKNINGTWAITSKKGQHIASFPSENEAMAWWKSFCEARDIHFANNSTNESLKKKTKVKGRCIFPLPPKSQATTPTRKSFQTVTRPKCRACGSPVVPGSDYCYSCG